jgi:hypothetical protein
MMRWLLACLLCVGTAFAQVPGPASPQPTAPQLRRATDVSPTLAVLATPVFPGWGQLYADNGWRAVLAFGTEMYFVTRMLSHDRLAVRGKDLRALTTNASSLAYYDLYVPEEWERMRDNAWWGGGVLLIIALDAYVGGHLHRFDEDPVPVPRDWEPAEAPQAIELPPAGPADLGLTLGWTTTF